MEKDHTTNNSKYFITFSELYIIVLYFINQKSFRQEKQQIEIVFVSVSGYKTTIKLRVFFLLLIHQYRSVQKL
jgi:hypothetical protein